MKTCCLVLSSPSLALKTERDHRYGSLAGREEDNVRYFTYTNKELIPASDPALRERSMTAQLSSLIFFQRISDGLFSL